MLCMWWKQLFIRFKEHTGRNRNYGFSLQVLFHCGNRLTHLCRLHCEQDDVTLPYHINCMFACMHPTHFCISAQLIPLPGSGIQLLSLYNSTRKHSICHGLCHISKSDKSYVLFQIHHLCISYAENDSCALSFGKF